MVQRISLIRAVLYIAISALIVSGGAIGIWRYYRHNQLERLQDPAYLLTTIVQAPREVLKSEFFEELFDLSVDHPTNCYAFDVGSAVRKLTALTAMREDTVKVKVLPPNTLYVEYILRTPVAYLGNYTNTLVDAEGVSFPAEPFFTPKRLPEFFLDLNDKDSFPLAMRVAEQIGGEGVRVRRVDFSRMNANSCGRREMVAIVESDQGSEHFLRLDVDDWEDGLKRYRVIKSTLDENAVVDLRIKYMAFVGCN